MASGPDGQNLDHAKSKNMSLYERLLDKRPAIYLTPEDMLAEAVEYFKWSEDNPLQDEQVNVWRGAVIRTSLDKMRPFTKQGLATHLRITVNKLSSFKGRGEDWAEVMELIEQVIYEQKFSGATAGLMNATIIGRDLGLAEKQELSAPDGPIEQVVVYGLPDNGRA